VNSGLVGLCWNVARLLALGFSAPIERLLVARLPNATRPPRLHALSSLPGKSRGHWNVIAHSSVRGRTRRNLEHVLASQTSWAEFETTAATLGSKQQGDLFELLTKYYLLLKPEYRTKLSDVWLLEEVPEKVRSALKLPGPDQGIDLIAEIKSGGYWAIQCKYRTDKKRSLNWRELSTFTGLAFSVCNGITHALVAHTGERYTKVLKEAAHVSFLSGDKWSTLEPGFFAELSDHLQSKPHPLVPVTPRSHQQRAVDSARDYFSQPGNVRGKIIMPCATGKSLTGFWIADALSANTIVVAVPSLALIEQTLPVWLREFRALGQSEGLRWLCVCSDETVTKGMDSVIVHTQDLPYDCTTTVEEIVAWLNATNTVRKRVIFTTYQSGRALSQALSVAGMEVDLAILDEAHKTVGDKKRLFSHLLFDENLPIKRRVFMTATERRFAADSDAVVSMDDAAIYGDTIELLTFKTALEQDPAIICEYKIVTMVISQREVETLIAQNRYLRPEAARWDDEVEAQMLASLIALRKAMHKYPIRHAVSFHSSIARAKAFRDFNDIYTQTLPNSGALDTFHVTGAMPAALRKGMMVEFAKAQRALVTNARCLTEGVDVPNIDCVLFADPKQSTIDIVQAVGRALRPAKHKHSAYVVVPVVAQDVNGAAFVESKAFAAVLTVLRALAANDERIIAWLRARQAGRKSKGGIIDFDMAEAVAYSIDLKDFTTKIETKVWDRLARLSWRTYDEAVSFVHALALKSQTEWGAYLRGERPDLPAKPADVPAFPTRLYGKEFGEKGGWGGWLGTGNRKGGWRPYNEAVTFVHGLELKSGAEWRAYCRGERLDLPKKPADVPYWPSAVYGKEFAQRGGMGGWLGTGTVAPRLRIYRPYDDAVSFVHGLGLKSEPEWRAYCRGERPDLPAKPVDVPGAPASVYGDVFRQRGGVGAWLGTRRVADQLKTWRLYDDAVRFVRGLGLNSYAEWRSYCQGKRSDLPTKPDDVPSNPYNAYGEVFTEKGGMRTWLRLNQEDIRKGGWRSYNEAVTFVHGLELKSGAEWRAYCRGERLDLPKKPADVPNGPSAVYGKEFAQRGGMGGWLGTGTVAPRLRIYRPYDDAVSFVHGLGLKSEPEWRTYCRGERPDLPAKPEDVPASPYKQYRDAFRKHGGWGAWLGTGTIWAGNRTYRPYAEAVKFVHPLGLKGASDWRKYCRGERPDLPAKPTDIPASPGPVYGDEYRVRGGFGAWLGTWTVAPQSRTYRSYDEAVTFVHRLELKSGAEWRAYCRGERMDLPAKLADIPADPAGVYGEEFRQRGGWGAFLGTGNRKGGWRSYDEAVTFVHGLGLKRRSDWAAYCRDGRTDLPAKPIDIPTAPDPIYGDEFRKRGGWGAWLGTSNRKGGWRSYDEAVTFVHGLGLKRGSDWAAYCRDGRTDLPVKPTDIPTNPGPIYGDEFRKRGGWGAWLGTGRRSPRQRRIG
jgi:superfamily II DNA or RNA helicase